jgi:TRAP-type C4-dicarboxylate transport system permease small subunit
MVRMWDMWDFMKTIGMIWVAMILTYGFIAIALVALRFVINVFRPKRRRLP